MGVKCPCCGVHVIADSLFIAQGHRVAGQSGESMYVGDMSVVRCAACKGFFVTVGGRPVWPLLEPILKTGENPQE